MAAVALNNVKREAAHKEAEADVARFEAREEAAKQKRAREMVARQGMDNEREKNRQRKLGAQGIRQWDQGKDDSALSSATTSKGQTSNGHEGAASAQSNKEAGREGYGDPFRSSYRGHISYGRLTSSGYGHQPSGNGSGTNNGSDNSRGAPRGRGRAMGRGQRGSGRGNTNGRPAAVTSGTRVASQPAKEDFPALPANTKPSVPKDGEQALETVVKSDADSHTWADQVEASQ